MDEPTPLVEPVIEKPPKRRKGCLIALAILGAILLVLGIWLGPVIRDGLKSGLIQSALSSDPKNHYDGATTENLQAMRTALLLYHDSEGQFPQAAGWMDAIDARLLNTSDLASKAEAEKKLIRPSLRGNADQFGYAINDAVAGKYKGDIKDLKTPLVFETDETKRNAHGDPKAMRMKNGLAIALDGTILKP